MFSSLRVAIVIVALCAVSGTTVRVHAQSPPQAKPKVIIQDNSFLIEEAYNQEKGIVQHISGFTRQRDGSWVFSFTDEWPLFSLKHQLSVTFLGGHVRESQPDIGRKFGDVSLNYRYQLVGDGNARVAIAPRITLSIPTGTQDIGLRSGGAGLQVNVPVSIVLHDRLVTHVNAGFAYFPSARNALGERASLHGYNFGDSVIWQVKDLFNLMLEAVYARSDFVSAARRAGHDYSMIFVPGVRWAHNFASGLQIVPGIGVPFGVGPSHGDRRILFYLSFEHPFTK
jgi:hypothetical protein